MLTDAKLRALLDRQRDERKALPDGKALFAVVQKSGAIQFVYRYRVGGESDRYIYGNFPAVSLAEARERHHRNRELVRQGVNPNRLEQEQREAAERARAKEAAADTVASLAAEFLDRYIRKERKTHAAVERAMNVDVVPIIGEIKVDALTRRDVVKMLDRIVDRGSPVQANATLALVKQMLGYAVERGILENNVAASIRRKTVGGVSKPRERVLSREEIRAVWKALDEFSAPLPQGMPKRPGVKLTDEQRKRVTISRPIALALQLLLVTAQRRGELSCALWKQVDLDKRLWHLPETKNGKAHVVHLSDLAVELFEELRTHAAGSPFVLPGLDRTSFITERVVTKAAERLRDSVLKDDETPLDHWSPHDLRRTAATHMAERPISAMPHVIEKILNHTLEGVLGVYQRQELFEERRAALEAWGRELRVIVHGADVISLAAAR